MQSPWYASPAMSKSHGNEPSSALVGVGRFELPTSRRGGVVSGVPRQPLAEPRAPRRGAAEVRECTVCPPWVLRCAHWDGQVLIIAHEAGVPEHCGITDVIAPYCVVVVAGFELCVCGTVLVLKEIGAWNGFDTDSLPAAEAEFRAREAQLLGRAE